MKQLKKISLLVCMGLCIISCSKSDNEPYFPDPNKGDFVKVTRMDVIDNLEKATEVSTRFDISYTKFLKVKDIREYHDLNVLQPVGPENLKYSFEYLKDNSVNSITVVEDDKVEVDRLIASYKNGTLVELKGDKSGISVVYEYSNENIIKATKGNQSFGYKYDARGNLTSVSDNNGKLLFSYTYNKGYNPFVHSEFNLLFNYIPGGDLICFLQSTPDALVGAKNEVTGEEFSMTYEYDDFSYPTNILMSSKDSSMRIKFIYKIFRAPEAV